MGRVWTETFRINPFAAERPRIGRTWSGKLNNRNTPAYNAKMRELHYLARDSLNKASIYKPLEGPVGLTIRFFVEKAKKPNQKCQDYPVKTPDLSNYVKAVEDSLNKAAFLDDCQIQDLIVSKRYGEPRIEVELYRLA